MTHHDEIEKLTPPEERRGPDSDIRYPSFMWNKKQQSCAP
jgi:hypothetical protein